MARVVKQVADLPSLPKHGWPQGWYRNTATYGCVGTPRGHKIWYDEPIYLDGESGHMYCVKHAPVPLP
jgi:hypothetical protein